MAFIVRLSSNGKHLDDYFVSHFKSDIRDINENLADTRDELGDTEADLTEVEKRIGSDFASVDGSDKNSLKRRLTTGDANHRGI